MITAVDLRPDYDKVYNQGQDNSCVPHGITNALDCLFERATGQPHRFDQQYLWEWARAYQGMPTANVGVSFEGAEQALRHKGAKLKDSETPITGFTLVRSYNSDKTFAELKERLRRGIPTLWALRAGSGFDNRNNGKPWREHTWGQQTAWQYTHMTCIVGFDDAAGRYLVENSWGADWGDGGYFGVPYDQFAALSDEWWHLDFCPVPFVPVDGYEMTTPAMLTAEKAKALDRANPALKEHLMGTLSNGVPALIAECVKWGVSDKHLEAMAGWPRGAVRGFKADNPGLVWDGFVWDQL